MQITEKRQINDSNGYNVEDNKDTGNNFVSFKLCH